MWRSNFGFAWLFLWSCLLLHAWDEAAHSFLTYYNSTVLTLYGHFQGFFPRIDLEHDRWLELWGVVILLGLGLTPWAFRNARWMQWLGFAVAGLVFLVGVGFIVAQILGGPLGSVQFVGVGPGVYTAPLLIIAADYLYWTLRKLSRDRH